MINFRVFIVLLALAPFSYARTRQSKCEIQVKFDKLIAITIIHTILRTTQSKNSIVIYKYCNFNYWQLFTQ